MDVMQALAAADPRVQWAVAVDVDGQPVVRHAADSTFATASVGKVFLLVALARAFADGLLHRDEPLARTAEDAVADSGLWQYLPEGALSAEALAVMVGAVSDNLATNVLLRRLTVAHVQEVSQLAGVPRTRLLDRIRDERGPGVPPRPSEGTAADLVRFMRLIAEREVLHERVCAEVEHWLSLNTDLSMVAAGLALDPLAHTGCGVRFFNKTGTDLGVRADTGYLEVSGRRVAYAVLANWEDERVVVGEVLAVMRGIGVELARA